MEIIYKKIVYNFFVEQNELTLEFEIKLQVVLLLDNELVLGNLESRRDWGRAQDYVEAMWSMLRHDVPDDYVVATGETHSVQEFVEAAFAVVNLPWQKFLRHNSSFDRPAEPSRLVGCADKIRKTLGWRSAGTFPELVHEIVEAELNRKH